VILIAVLFILAGLALAQLSSAPVKAQDPSPTPAKKSSFRLIMTNSASTWDAFRLNPQTGETWTPNVTGANWVWQKIFDTEKLPISDYDLQAASVGGTDGGEEIIRIDRKTGQSWRINNGAWAAIPEPN
jgi:hypothetical protein